MLNKVVLLIILVDLGSRLVLFCELVRMKSGLSVLKRLKRLGLCLWLVMRVVRVMRKNYL